MPQLRPLTGMRFLLALWVVVHHFGTPLVSALTGGLPGPWQAAAQNLVKAGSLGVNLFFILSGFILAYNYVVRDEGLKGTAREFWLARFARIYPAYLTALIVAYFPFQFITRCTAVTACGASGHAVTITSALVLLQGWIPGSQDVWNPPGWSLSAEAFFYLSFPLLVVGMARMSGRRLAVAALGCWLVTAGIGLAYVATLPDGSGALPFAARAGYPAAPWLDYIVYNPLIHLPEFLLGMCLGLLYLRRDEAGSIWMAVLRYRRVVTWSALVALLALLASNDVPYIFPRVGLLDVLLCAVMFGFAFDGGWGAWVLASGWLVFLGEASYSVYLLHFPLHQWLDALTRFFLPQGNILRSNGALWFVLYLGITLAASALCYLRVERPMRRRIRALGQAPSVEPVRSLS